MPLLALSMLCTTLIGIEPNSRYATRTLLIAIFRIDVVWIWTTHKACTLYFGGNRTHRQNPNVFNPYACLLPIRCLPFCIHINIVKYNSRRVTTTLKLLLPLHCTVSCGLSTAYGKVHPCRKFNRQRWESNPRQVGWQPTALPLSYKPREVGSVASSTLPVENKYWGILSSLAEWSVQELNLRYIRERDMSYHLTNRP